jgi:hypothetical protein
MVPRIILASSHERPSDVDGRFPLDEADDLGYVLWFNQNGHLDKGGKIDRGGVQ